MDGLNEGSALSLQKRGRNDTIPPADDARMAGNDARSNAAVHSAAAGRNFSDALLSFEVLQDRICEFIGGRVGGFFFASYPLFVDALRLSL